MIAKVIIDRSSSDIDKTFDYYIPDNLVVNKGDRLLVPFGKVKAPSFCIDIVEESEFNTKSISSVLEQECISAEMIELMHYMHKRFFLKYADILRLFIPSSMRKDKNADLKRLYLKINESISVDDMLTQLSKGAKKQIELLQTFPKEGMFLQEALSIYSDHVIKNLVQKGFLIKDEKKIDRVPFKDIVGLKKDVVLTEEQEKALKKIFDTEKKTILLEGVTGSGKTRVYIEAIKKVLAEGKNAIMLVPEIALTPQMLNNFRGIFNDKVALLHSGLTAGERYDEWKKLKDGEAKIVVGARSGIFAPLKNVGLIVIDEEHDTSYISESNPRYRVLEIAQFRAKYNDAKVVLGSATPSIETYKRALSGEYELIKMTKRISKNGMPDIEIIDMKDEILRGNFSMFSRALQDELQKVIDKKEQAMLLINRLGFSSFIRCNKCGYVPKCSHCDVSLTYHKNENKLVCHYCGTKYSMLSQCPECGSNEIKHGKMGTERVVEELQKLFKGIKVLKLDSDSKKHKDETKEILTRFANNEAQILVGTQMIAKGHDFPNVTLVGLVDADLGLYQQDFRSNERTFQLVTQMAGRAGRAEKVGRVLLQTYSPTSYVYRFAIDYDYENFYRKEVNIRETTNFPPFVSIVRILVVSEKKEMARDVARMVYIKVRDYKNDVNEIVSLAGMECPINMMKSNYRYQVVLRIKKENELQTLNKLYEIIGSVDKKKTSIFVEQDPQSLV